MAWIQAQLKPQVQDGRVVDDALEGVCYDVAGQVVLMIGFFAPLRPPSSQLVLLPSFYAHQLQLLFSCPELLPFPFVSGHPTLSESP